MKEAITKTGEKMVQSLGELSDEIKQSNDFQERLVVYKKALESLCNAFYFSVHTICKLNEMFESSEIMEELCKADDIDKEIKKDMRELLNKINVVNQLFDQVELIAKELEFKKKI